jgi:hypothetical protein
VLLAHTYHETESKSKLFARVCYVIILCVNLCKSNMIRAKDQNSNLTGQAEQSYLWYVK